MIVLAALTEKQVVITDNLNTNPIEGRRAIFARVNAPTEARIDVEIVGVYTTLDNARVARENHAKAHPGRKYLQKVATLDDVPEPVKSECVKCGVETPGLSYCQRCQAILWAEAREADPLAGAGDDVPVVKATAGPDTRFVNAR